MFYNSLWTPHKGPTTAIIAAGNRLFTGCLGSFPRYKFKAGEMVMVRGSALWDKMQNIVWDYDWQRRCKTRLEAEDNKNEQLIKYWQDHLDRVEKRLSAVNVDYPDSMQELEKVNVLDKEGKEVSVSKIDGNVLATIVKYVPAEGSNRLGNTYIVDFSIPHKDTCHGRGEQ